MIADLEGLYSQNAKNLEKSVIRELLKLTTKPGIISFAGGLPAPETFPVNDVKAIVNEMLDEEGTKALQYGTTEGEPALKEEIIKFMEKDGITGLTPDNILVMTASQQALDMVCKVFINPNDPVILELPSYVGMISAMRSYGARMIGINAADDGMEMDKLESELKRLGDMRERVKFVYVIPDFQNPAGITMSLEKRQRLVELAHKYQFIIMEDSPYRNLRYNGETIPSIYSLDKEGHTVGLYTFSKIFAPGLRLGWVIGPAEIINKFVVARQAMDLCTPPFTQKITSRYMKRGLIYDRITKNVELYRIKKDAMLKALETYMPKHAELNWTKPEGGMFLWLRLPEYINTEEMFYKAIENNVAYVVGSAFYCNDGGHNTMRLNFSYPTLEQIDEGTKRLARVIEDVIQRYEKK